MTDLFAYARRCDPATSKVAANGVKVGTIRADVLAALQLRPMTTHEIAAQTGRALVSISPRIATLRDVGLVRNSGQVRRGASGANSIVWELVEKGG